MNPTAFEAGSKSRSDCRAVYDPDSARLEVKVQSSVGSLFGKAIEATVRRTAAEFGASTGRLGLEDDSALDYVVEARVEAVLRLAGFGRPRGDNGKAPHSDGASSLRLAGRNAAERKAWPRGGWCRARLYLPGDQPHLAINAGLFGADCLIFDLEDAVAESRKFESRILVRRTLEASAMLGSCQLAVRINPLSGPWGKDDLAEIVRARPHAVILPKCESAAEVTAADEALAALEKASGIESGFVRLMPLVETAKGVLAAGAIAAASARNAALCFGREDFTRDIKAAPRAAALRAEAASSGIFADPTLFARQMIVLAARAAGIDPLDSVYADVEDEAGLLRSCLEAKALGFSGKGLLHPSQIPVTLAAFRPSAEEAARAARIVAAFDAALAEGKGAISVDGSMVDAPVAEKARAVLAACGEGEPR
jgi:citrate lyase subunit beta / citryl-CoA lyase